MTFLSKTLGKFSDDFTKVTYLPWLMWGIATLFFAYQFIMRLAPGLVMSELMQKFHVDATDYGLFAASYYFAYSGMQIPVALLLDRLGPRWVITFCAFTCSLGTLMLVYTNHWSLALVSRFLIGAGSAAGFLGASKVISHFFPAEKYTRMVGLTFTFGLLGAVYGGKPVSHLITEFGWFDVLLSIGWVGLAVAVLVAVVVRNPKEDHKLNQSRSFVSKSSSLGSTLKTLKSLVTDPKLVLLALANLLMVGSLEGFADVWGVPFLSATKNISKDEAAQIVSFVFVGMLFGGPLLAFISDKIRSSYKVTCLAGILLCIIFVTLLAFYNSLSNLQLITLFFFTGILCCYQVLVFSMGVSLVPKEISGMTVAFLNCINMLGGSFFHSTIGFVLDLNWQQDFANDLRVYQPEAFVIALSIIPVTALIGGLCVYFLEPKAEVKNLEC